MPLYTAKTPPEQEFTMPKYSLTSTWSDPIPVAAGNYVQNQSGEYIEICAITPASSDDAVKIPAWQAVTIASATSIRARRIGNWPADLVVAGGI